MLEDYAVPTKVELDFYELPRDYTTAVAVTSTEIIPPNKNRTMALLINDSDTPIYLALGIDAVLNRGIRLNALGGAFEINKTNLFKGRILAIHGGAATKVLLALELESRYAT